MTIQQIYNLAIKMGIEADLRGKKAVNKVLDKAKTKFEKMSAEEKKFFDKEKFINPFSDTRILNDSKKEIKKVLVGIDIGPDEILLADRLGNIDLIISHHPSGPALADLHDVMNLQAEVLAGYGIPINQAEGLLKERIEEVSRGVAPINHMRAVDTAKLLGIGLMCIHTPTDNLAAKFLDKGIKKKKSETVSDIIKLLREIPEYEKAAYNKVGPRIWVGSPENSTGKIVLTEITGGTEGAVGIYEKMAQYGIGTVIGMHMDEERKKEAQKYHINVVIAGHMSSDSLGMNQFLDELEKRGVKIVPCSGLIRVSRMKKKMAKKITRKKLRKRK